MGKGLILLGLVIVVVGVVLTFAPGLLSWFGKLPGDIRIESEHSKVFIPITSMVVLSIVLSLLLHLLGRH